MSARTSLRIVSSVQEGLYSIITVFLVLRCTSSKMFGQRLMRKVGRQFVVMLFIDLWRPVLLFASSPVNCIQDAIRHPTEDLIGRHAVPESSFQFFNLLFSECMVKGVNLLLFLYLFKGRNRETPQVSGFRSCVRANMRLRGADCDCVTLQLGNTT